MISNSTPTQKDRVRGALIGLMAGDKNGGPLRMAVRLAESLFENKGFSKQEVIEKYLNWFKGPPFDEEKAFDTGAVFARVFKLVNSGTMSCEEAAQDTQNRLKSAGVNNAHRNAVIASCFYISDDILPSVIKEESEITHLHELSIGLAIVVNTIERSLIKGSTINDSISKAMAIVKQIPEIANICNEFLSCEKEKINETTLNNDGFAPNVLKASLYFITTSRNFDEALDRSCHFAGALNFCPVIVGAIAGCLFGSKSINTGHYSHVNSSLRKRVTSMADAFADNWQS